MKNQIGTRNMSDFVSIDDVDWAIEWAVECSESDHKFSPSSFVGLEPYQIPAEVYQQLENIDVGNTNPVEPDTVITCEMTSLNQNYSMSMSETRDRLREQHHQAPDYYVELYHGRNIEPSARIKVPANTMFKVFWKKLKEKARAIANTNEYVLKEDGKKINESVLINMHVQRTYRFVVCPRVP